MKKHLIFTCIIVFFVSGLIGCQRSALKKVGDYLDKAEPDTIWLSNFTNFDWDTVWIISSQMKGDYLFLFKEKNIPTSPIENNINRSFGLEQEFSSGIVIFTYKNKVVHYEFPPLKDPWFLDSIELLNFNMPSDSLSTKYYIFYLKTKRFFM